jgi:phosphate ABC transporter phosphate-binding protein
VTGVDRADARAHQPLAPGDPRKIGGYRLRAVLGDGGMGKVYLAHTADGGPVAVKVIRGEYAQDRSFRKRFEQEVATARRVSGPHTAPVIDADPAATQPWLATAYVPGPSLAQVVAEHGPLPPETALTLVAGVAEALESIHAAGVIHRDLKPSNVILAEDGPKVIDFGIARAADVTSVTRTGMAPGTPAYMAPEHIRGTELTPAADVFALGVLAGFAATGRLAFGGGQDPAVPYRILEQEPNLDGCPDRLREIVLACLDKQSQRRPTPGEVAQRCRASPVDAQWTVPGWQPAPPTPTLTRPRPVRRRTWLAVTGALVLLAGLAVVAYLSGLFDERAAGTPSAQGTTAPVAVDCGGAKNLTAAGSTVQGAAFDLFTAVYQQKCADVRVNYAPMGSGAGVSQFLSGQADIAGTDSALSRREADQAVTRCQGNPAWNLPTVISPIAIAYRLDGVEDLTLTGELAAKIFNGTIRAWNDPAIAAANPGLPLPAKPITVLARSDESVVTDVFQQYLTRASAGAWTQGPGRTFNGAARLDLQGSSRLADALASADGGITYLEWTYTKDLPTARLDSGSGAVPLTAETAAAALRAAPVEGASENDLPVDLSAIHGGDTPGGYPLLLVTYEVVCSGGYPPETAAAVKAFLTTAVTDGQQGLIDRGYAPVPEELRGKLLAAIEAIR